MRMRMKTTKMIMMISGLEKELHVISLALEVVPMLSGWLDCFWNIMVLRDSKTLTQHHQQVGITTRNEIGMLVWLGEEATDELNIGSRVKTPVLPIWVTCIHDQWGVLFNPNRDLMKSYSSENRFGVIFI